MTDGSAASADAAPHDLPHDALTEQLTRRMGFLHPVGAAIRAVQVAPTRRSKCTTRVPFGRLFRLDGHFMTSEKDEFFYHENLVHLAALTHPRPERALIVGGGDGGSAEELLKHPSIRSVTLAEIDVAVVDIARKYLGAVHGGALDDPRLTLKIGDGFAYVRAATERFDLIVLDLTDPGGPSELLYTPDFYRACAARLNPGGAMTLHIASPIAHPDRIRATLGRTARGLPAGHALSDVDTAVRRPVDDGVRVDDARPAEPVGGGGRPPHRGAGARQAPVLQRRHAPRGARAPQFRPRARRLKAPTLTAFAAPRGGASALRASGRRTESTRAVPPALLERVAAFVRGGRA